MTPQEIRALNKWAHLGGAVPDEILEVQVQIEIAAQLAEIAEALRTRNTKTTTPRKPKEVSSSARHSSNGKTFRVAHWGTTVTPSMLPAFTPNPGYKELEQLAPGETTIGTLGTQADAEVTRKQ